MFYDFKVLLLLTMNQYTEVRKKNPFKTAGHKKSIAG